MTIATLVVITGAIEATPVFEPIQAFSRCPEKPRSKLVQGSDGSFYGTSNEGGLSGLGTVFKVTSAGALTVLVNFNSANGSHPLSGVIQGSDGDFYGTTNEGGTSGAGTVFRMTASGVLTTLVNCKPSTGSYPFAALVQGSDGNLYGTTPQGGSGNNGTVFKLTPGGTLTTLVNFSSTNGGYPIARLVEGKDGNFYGTTNEGGSNGNGTVFKVTPGGSLTTLVHFLNGSNGRAPFAGLIQGSDGNFYGTTSEGGSSFEGTVFRMTPAGVLTTLINFNVTNGNRPYGDLVQGNDGNFYGTTYYGGSGSNGTVFKVSPAGTLTTLVIFSNTNGALPFAGMVRGADGSLYGTTESGGSSGLGSIYKITPAGAFTTVAHLLNSKGTYPWGGLIQGNDGHFYGTTYSGGSSGLGAVFKVTSAGVLTSLVSFNNSNGSNPYGSLAKGSDGNFYGTTSNGGSSGNGTVFRMTPAGVLTTLVHFNSTNGRWPYAGLVQGSDGNFYGTTLKGGNVGNGTVFKMTPNGVLTTLVHFNYTNGESPNAAMLQANDGSFYGTTSYGGVSGGYGTVFKVTSAGAITTLVHFNSTNGSNPQAALLQGSDGNFYGTTSEGGIGNGTIFKMTPTGVLTTLVRFNGANGRSSKSALVQGSDGDLFGTTVTDSGGGYGTIFKVSSAGTLNTLFKFNYTSGGYPLTGFFKAVDGHLYGTASSGGTTSEGTPGGGGQIFRLRLGPNVSSLPADYLTDTSVTLNGTVNPGDFATPVSFQYGSSPTLSTFTTVSVGTAPAANEIAGFQAALTGLIPGTTYYFRIVASNAENLVPQTGAILNFTTPAFPDIAVEAPVGTPVANDAGTLDFGQKPPGQTKDAVIVIRNTSPYALLNAISASLVGSDADQFEIFSQPAASVATFTLCTIRFSPNSSGSKSATLSITSNDPDENPFTVTLTGVGNTEPTFAGYSVGTGYQKAVSLSFGKLLAKASDADGNPLYVSAAGIPQRGGSVSLAGSLLVYTPAAGFSGLDTFSLTITDSLGATASGTVSIAVAAADGNTRGQGLNTPVLSLLSSGKLEITFLGIPGRTYEIQRSTDLSQWNRLGTATTEVNGIVHYTDESPPPGTSFYRLKVP